MFSTLLCAGYRQPSGLYLVDDALIVLITRVMFLVDGILGTRTYLDESGI